MWIESRAALDIDRQPHVPNEASLVGILNCRWPENEPGDSPYVLEEKEIIPPSRPYEGNVEHEFALLRLSVPRRNLQTEDWEAEPIEVDQWTSTQMRLLL